MAKKFKLTNNSIDISEANTTVYQIEALRDFGNVKKGDRGGFIQSEDNLSQEGNCWVYDMSKVMGNARVSGNARVLDSAWLSDNAQAYDNAVISDSILSYNAKVYGNAIVKERAWITGNAKVYDNAEVCCYNACVYGDAAASPCTAASPYTHAL